MYPRVSVITVCLNSAEFIKDTVESVINQSYPNIEYIIIDGKSTDNTIEIIKSYGEKITKLISEPDSGFYDAMNKGISLVTGEFVCILNSDDIFIDKSVIENVIEIFKNTGTDCVYGDLYYVRRKNTNKIIRHWITGEFKTGAFKKGWHPAHPAFFLRREIYENNGVFDLSFPLAADFELMLRMLENFKISSVYLPVPLIKMRLGGVTNRNVSDIIKQNIECVHAFEKNGLTAGGLYMLYRLLPKIKQFLN